MTAKTNRPDQLRAEKLALTLILKQWLRIRIRIIFENYLNKTLSGYRDKSGDLVLGKRKFEVGNAEPV